MISADKYNTEALSNVRPCWKNVSLQGRLPILRKVYHDALVYRNIVDEPAQVKQVLQDKPGNCLDDLRAYMSDNEKSCDTSQSVDLQNHDNDHDHVSVSTSQADAEPNV
jgi:hypothetical protein